MRICQKNSRKCASEQFPEKLLDEHRKSLREKFQEKLTVEFRKELSYNFKQIFQGIHKNCSLNISRGNHKKVTRSSCEKKSEKFFLNKFPKGNFKNLLVQRSLKLLEELFKKLAEK